MLLAADHILLLPLISWVDASNPALARRILLTIYRVTCVHKSRQMAHWKLSTKCPWLERRSFLLYNPSSNDCAVYSIARVLTQQFQFVNLLKIGPFTVSRLVNQLKIGLFTVSRHAVVETMGTWRKGHRHLPEEHPC